MRELQVFFDEMVPGAADKANLFLQVLQERAQAENLGLTFAAKELRKTRQLVLVAPIQLAGKLFTGAPMQLMVHADPVGSALQVGWQLTEDSVHSSLMVFDSVASGQASRTMRNYTPDAQRKLNGLLNAFHGVVFMPVLELLVEAIEQKGRSGRGFSGP